MENLEKDWITAHTLREECRNCKSYFPINPCWGDCQAVLFSQRTYFTDLCELFRPRKDVSLST